MHSISNTRSPPVSQPLRRKEWQLGATPASRHAKAAIKYNTGPRSTLYTRPDLASLLDLDVHEAMKAHSSRAAQDPQMYAHKLAVQQQQQLEDNERVNWNEIL